MGEGRIHTHDALTANPQNDRNRPQPSFRFDSIYQCRPPRQRVRSIRKPSTDCVSLKHPQCGTECMYVCITPRTSNPSIHTVATGGGSSAGSRKRGRGGEGEEASSVAADAPPAKVMATGVGKEETPEGGEGGAVGGGSPKQQGPGAGAGAVWDRTKELQERIQEVEEEKRLIEEGAWGGFRCV